jgi:molybdate-binding protein
MKKPIFEDASFNFNHNGSYYNVKFIPIDNRRYKILIQDWNSTIPLFEKKVNETATKTSALNYLCGALNIK